MGLKIAQLGQPVLRQVAAAIPGSQAQFSEATLKKVLAVASDEVKRQGINAWKRDRLVKAGADIVIPEYRQANRLMAYLFDEMKGS